MPDVGRLPPTSRHSFSLRVTRMADGGSLCLPVNVLVGKEAGPRLLMVAGVHGNEHEGVMAQYELWEELSLEEVSGAVVMVPVANPPAFRVCQRRNPEDMLDMNRVFPGKPDGSITERLAYRLYHDIALSADFVLSMHGWTHGSLVVPYTEYPKDLAVTEVSRAAAIAFGLEYVEAFDWHPGLLVAACTEAGIPAIEPEIGGLSCTVPERRARYKEGVFNLMRHLNMLPGDPSPQDVIREVTRTMHLAPVGGVLRRQKELGDTVERGETIATICSLNGAPIESIEAPGDGFVAAQLLTAAVNPGDLIAVIFIPQEGS